MLKLVRYDDAWRPWPELAEEIPDGRNGRRRVLADGRVELTYRVRSGVRWHDGHPLTASDALFTYELLKATPPGYPHHTIVESIDEMLVDRHDPHELIVRWKATHRFAMDEEWGTVLPRHLLEGEGLERPAIRDAHPFLRAPVLSGPFRFSGWEPGKRIVLESVAPHPRGVPDIDRIEFHFYPGPDRLADAVIAGRVDVSDLTGFGPEHAERVRREANNVCVLETPSLNWEHLDLNLDDPVLADRRVRRALAHAIDLTSISDSLYRGRFEPADSWLPPRHPAYNPHIRRYEHDCGEAERLLDAAGYGRRADGRRVNAAGEPLTLHLVTTPPAASGGLWTSSSTRAQLAGLIREQLALVGIELQVELMSGDELFPRIRARQFRQIVLFAWSMSLEATGYLMWHSDKIPQGEDWYGLNVSGWRHDENDRILDAITEALDLEERYALMREQQLVWAQELPSLPLFFPPSVSTARAGLRNVKPVGVFGTYVTWNSWEWSWKPTPGAGDERQDREVARAV
jgi:peptide/nickel transport system substrate-binding protein